MINVQYQDCLGRDGVFWWPDDWVNGEEGICYDTEDDYWEAKSLRDEAER